MADKIPRSLVKEIHKFLADNFSPAFGEISPAAGDNKLWEKLKSIGTELWLDTGNIDEISKYYTPQFTAVTTNNTLLNKEVQTGVYDSLISRIAGIVDKYGLDEKQRMLEFAFALNAWHALKLVEKFDAYVSVEEHTALANDVELAVDYAKRYHSICPERFIVKIPFTPAGLLATRKVSGQGIPVNHTLGFSARQNYLIARIAKPQFVNVFLGRLNSFTADNELGTGEFVGEKAAIASNSVVRELRQSHSIPTRQIAASLRSGQQICSLAGVDVMTMPAKAAGQFLEMDISPDKLADCTDKDYEPGVYKKEYIEKIRLDTLWDIPERLVECVDKLERENLETWVPNDIVEFFRDNGCGDIIVDWSDDQIETNMKEGKIPRLENWRKLLEGKEIGLDSLMNLAGLNSFTADQKKMDSRVKDVLDKNKTD